MFAASDAFCGVATSVAVTRLQVVRKRHVARPPVQPEPRRRPHESVHRVEAALRRLPPAPARRERRPLRDVREEQPRNRRHFDDVLDDEAPLRARRGPPPGPRQRPAPAPEGRRRAPGVGRGVLPAAHDVDAHGLRVEGASDRAPAGRWRGPPADPSQERGRATDGCQAPSTPGGTLDDPTVADARRGSGRPAQGRAG